MSNVQQNSEKSMWDLMYRKKQLKFSAFAARRVPMEA